jgi:hypothetical protein
MIRPATPADLDGIRDLLLAEGWGARVEDPQRLRRIVESATRAVVADEDGEVVGFGRCVTDDTPPTATSRWSSWIPGTVGGGWVAPWSRQ